MRNHQGVGNPEMAYQCAWTSANAWGKEEIRAKA
jgi:hypothetical protein